MESILTSIKLMLGITDEYKHFDTQIKVHINSVFMTLNQIGVGPAKCFSIASEMETWDKFLGDSMDDLQAVKDYVYLKVKMVFDPPQNSSHIASMERTITELEWRLTAQVELKAKEE